MFNMFLQAAGLRPRVPRPQDNIILKVSGTQRGWVLHYSFPRRVPASDRTAVLKSLQAYRAEIRRRFPLWLTKFESEKHGMKLEVTRIDTPEELVREYVGGRNPIQLMLDYEQPTR